MGPRRVVPNITSERFAESKAFYTDVLGFEVAMDLEWIVGFVSPTEPHPGIQIVSRDATAPVNPAVSIQVDDIDAVYAAAMKAGALIVHPITVEPWGVKRFFVQDPNGAVINVMTHVEKT